MPKESTEIEKKRREQNNKKNSENKKQFSTKAEPIAESIIHNNSESSTFCFIMPKSGEATKFEGKSPSDFLQHIKDVDFAWINFRVSDLEKDGPKVASEFGFTPNIVSNLVGKKFSDHDDIETELGLFVPAINIKDYNVQINKLIIIIKGNLILTLHDEYVTRLVKFSRYAGKFFKKIPKSIKVVDKISYVLIRILEENNSRNFDGIRQIQEQGEVVSKHLIEPTMQKKGLGTSIYQMKRSLLTYLEALWATLDVIQYLRYGDPEQLTDDSKILQKIGLIGSDLTMQISISEQMSTVLASGLEVLQSIYNNQLQILNNRMSYVVAWLTILGTAVLVPNTLGTIFGIGPISELLATKTMINILIASTIISVIGAYWFVKTKKILPGKIE